MKKINEIDDIGILLFGFGLVIVVLIFMAVLFAELSYRTGQTDALQGNWKYKADTTWRKEIWKYKADTTWRKEIVRDSILNIKISPTINPDAFNQYFNPFEYMVDIKTGDTVINVKRDVEIYVIDEIKFKKIKK